MKQNLKPLIALSVLILISSISFAVTPNLTAEKFTKASIELKKEQSNLNLIKKTPKQKENKLDLKSKANELGLSEQQLTAMMKNIGNDSTQTDALSSSVLTGQTAQDYFGYSVSKAGDINGDGYGDILIGSPGYNSGTGRVYVFFGGALIKSSPDLILTSSQPGENFGASVSDAGDLNGDGFGDFIVGAPYYDFPQTNTGRAIVYLGGNVINTNGNFPLFSSGTNAFFGTTVSCAGDVNGDGFDDLIIGAYNAGATNNGAAYIYFGGVNMNQTVDVTLSGVSAYDGLGFSVSEAGDVNGDGYADVIVGAPYNDAAASDAGRAYVYYGGASMNSTADVILNSTYSFAGDNFGYSVSEAGDVNADGYDDIIVGAPYSAIHGFGAGMVYVFYGGASPDNIADITFYGAAVNNYLGTNVGCAGDINCDGYSDIIIGTPYNDFTGTDYGAVYIYYGGTVLHYNFDITLYGNSTGDYFGFSTAGAGDINGDGISDFIVGSPFLSGSMTGKAFVYTNSMTGNDIVDLRHSRNALPTGYGYSVSFAGDLNGDGYDDYMIGDPFQGYVSWPQYGSIYIFYGGTSLNTQPDVTLHGIAVNTYLGYNISSLGDVNGDGYDDIISAYGNVANSPAYIYFGGSNMDTIPDVILSPEVGYNFGISLTNVGDINNDGYADVFIGEKSASQHGAGIYYGGRNIDNVRDVTFRFTYGTNSAVSSAGDVNKDGYTDLMIGHPGHYFVSLYYGSSLIDTTADLIFENLSSPGYGYSLSSGDINKDGYSDVIIGSPGNDDVFASGGKVFIYYGSANMDNIADAGLPGHETNEALGVSLSTGDINHDGYTDILVGAPINPTFRGKTFVYFGSAMMSTTAAITMNGQTAGEYFGEDVNCNGDFNGDGYDDMIINARLYNGGLGAVDVFLTTSTPVNPRILKVADVPNDQGGSVLLKFQRSGYDVIGQNKITSYIIERSRPPGANGFFWEQVASITPNNYIGYLYTAATWGDSSSNGNDKIYFRVTAKTLNASEFWRSNIMYGQSIDNLSPVAPAGLAAAPNSTRINLSWTANTESDMKDYLIYRNGVNISSANSISFADTTAVQDSIYIYKIAARDIHGNISPLSTADTASLESITTINVTVIPEGLLNTATGQLRMRDTVKAKLWDLTGSYIVDSATAVIDSITFIASFSFKNAPTGNYYLAVSHRNSIETWSKVGGESYTRGTIASYDFTSASTQAYGNNLKLKGGRYCMFTGDVNQSGVINSTDRTLIRSNVGQTGYIRYDLDGNGVVNSADRTIVRNNTGVARQRP